MKNKIALLLVGGFFLLTADLFAQEPENKFFHIGTGVSGYGIPIYASVEFPVKFPSQSFVLGGTFQSYRESYGILAGASDWRHTVIGIEAGWNYYFDEIMSSFLPDQFDVYASARVAYYIWNTTYTGSTPGFNDNYTGTGSGGVGVNLFACGRWHFKDNVSLFAELGGGSIISAARAGFSFRF